MEDGGVLFHPVGGHETFAGRRLQLLSDFRCLGGIVDLESQHAANVAQVAHLLRVSERDEGPGAVVRIEPRRENPRHLEALVLGNNAKWSELALGASDGYRSEEHT